ncbi:Putative Cation transport ATPase [Aspergillus calidoustus]|uniref:Putative Cation transport ATPase n=1 Tax=Aspergillus calidoustus TaxID=454130 RepID=A0A0U4YVP1_ASPCI|nr:Putative Cation transport ATPase [Aspergillus calidoustus]
MQTSSTGDDLTVIQKNLSPRVVESGSPRDDDLVSVVDDHLTGTRTRITLSISGMSCSSCVGKITNALNDQPWVQSADVNLLTSSAVVVLLDRSRVNEARETITGSGYSAQLIDCEDLLPKRQSKQSTSADIWRASYVIGGMTCSSCVGTVTDTLNRYEWVTKLDVNLVSGSATVELQGKEHLEEVIAIISELGYAATLGEVESSTPSEQRALNRSVTIQVDGMHCSNCPQRILDALSVFSSCLQVTDPLRKGHPRLTIAYTPDSPNFTIRHILHAIAQVDKAFTVSIYHSPSLEERSQMMQRRHMWRIARRLLLAVLTAIPAFIIGIVYMSLVPGDNSGVMYLEQPIWAGQVSRMEWALFIMATPVYFFAADLFHRRMLSELMALWRPGSKTPILRRFYRFGSMDMLMSLGTTVAYFSSIAILGINANQPADGHRVTHVESFFDSVVFLTMFLMIGRLLEAYSKAKAGDSVGLLGKLRPTTAVLVASKGTEPSSPSVTPHTVPIDQLELNDVVSVANGASPPYDGIVVEGTSRFDESSLTGESKPVPKRIGDEVFSGTINRANPVLIRITHLSGDSMLDQIISAVREGQVRRAPIERTADLITGYFVPLITIIAVLDWIIWLSLGVSGRLPLSWLEGGAGGWEFWSLQFAISVFVVACPCGIGLAAPTALFVGGGLAAQYGILVKGGGEAFQEASQLDCIVFDKTGTITEGVQPSITDHKTAHEENIDEVWGAVLTLEHKSSHPIAQAMVSFAGSRRPPALRASAVDEIPGKGMKGSFPLDHRPSSILDIIVGNEALMLDHEITISSANAAILAAWKREAKSVVLVGTRVREGAGDIEKVHWVLSMMLAVADPVRPEAKEVLQALRNRGISVWMISGDNPTTAHAVGKIVGISPENIIAGILPEQKAEKIRYLQKTVPRPSKRRWFNWGKESRRTRPLVAMVGDGINDSPALTVADVGIAIGSGSEIAISSAEFVLISSGLTSLLTLIDLSRIVFNRVKYNFGWALVYNCIAIPVAAGVFYPIVSNGNHIRLDPVWASLAMALSSVSVVCSSLLMRTRLPLVGFRSAK